MIQQILKDKLRGYIEQNNPDLLLQLTKDFSLTAYLEDKVAAIEPQLGQWIADGKPQYILEELAMNDLTEDLRPSKFNYIQEVLEEEFLESYNGFLKCGVLTYETINMIVACKPVFDAMGFTEENEDDRSLRYAIIGTIEEYLRTP